MTKPLSLRRFLRNTLINGAFDKREVLEKGRSPCADEVFKGSPGTSLDADAVPFPDPNFAGWPATSNRTSDGEKLFRDPAG